MPIGDTIKNILDKKNLKPAQLIKKIQELYEAGKIEKKGLVSQSYLSEILNGRYKNISAIKLNSIAKALKVSVSKLLEKSD